MDRELDATIAEEVLGWQYADVGPDAAGKNAGRVLAPGGATPAGFGWPRKGAVHRAYLAPFYSTRYDEAVGLARRVGLTTPVNELPATAAGLARACLEHWRAGHTCGRNPDGSPYRGYPGRPGSPPR